MCLWNITTAKSRTHYWKVFKLGPMGELGNCYGSAIETGYARNTWLKAADPKYGFHAFLTREEARLEKRDWGKASHCFTIKKVRTKDPFVSEGSFYINNGPLRAVMLRTMLIED